MTEEKIIRDEKAARALLEPKNLTLLELLLQSEKTLSELADELNVKLSTLHYRINALIKLGLAEVSRELPRGGRATKLYRASAECFLIPADLLPQDLDTLASDKLAQNMFEKFRRHFAKTLEAELGPRYLQFSAGSEKGITINNVFDREPNPDDPNFPAVMQSVGLTKLSFEAKTFQKELTELFERFIKNGSGKGQSYFFVLGLTPAQDGDASPW